MTPPRPIPARPDRRLGIPWDDLLDDLRTRPTGDIARERGCSFKAVQSARRVRGIQSPQRRGPKQFQRNPVGDGRERFSVRLTAGLWTAIWRTRGRLTTSERLRVLLVSQLDGGAWPPFVDGARDEGAGTWAQVRLSRELQSAIFGYQQAVGCRDLSAAVRSLVASALAMEAG